MVSIARESSVHGLLTGFACGKCRLFVQKSDCYENKIERSAFDPKLALGKPY